MFGFFKKRKKEFKTEDIVGFFEKIEKEINEMKEEIENIKKREKFNFKKMGIVRFNPFKEVGGNQSFSLALLDENDNGMIITSLYTREGNRIYGKPLKEGKSEYLLTEEEKKAIEIAKFQNYGK